VVVWCHFLADCPRSLKARRARVFDTLDLKEAKALLDELAA
jgi:hypothetical protein